MPQTRSVYNAGANDGLIMGLYLSSVFVLQVLGMHSVILLLLSELMMVCVPVLAYILLRREYRLSMGYHTFSAVWLHGIIMFLCASLILAVVMYVYMRYVNITYVADQFQTVAAMLREIGTPEAEQQAELYDKILEKHLVPSPIYVAFGFVWLVSFTGAMLSIVLALLVRAFNRKIINQNDYYRK